MHKRWVVVMVIVVVVVLDVEVLCLLPPCLSPFSSSSSPQADQDDDKAMAAQQCLEAINTLVQSVHEHKPLLAIMEKDVVPVIALILGYEG